MLTWILRISLFLILIAGSAVGILLVAEPTLQLTPYRETIARHLSTAIDREITLGGELTIHTGRHTRLRLRDVRIANAAWAASPDMLHVGTVDVGIDLAALFSGVLHLEDIVVRDLSGSFEKSTAGEANWQLGKATTLVEKAPPAEESGGLSIVIDEATLENIDLSYLDPTLAKPVNLRIARLKQHNEAGMLLLDGHGHLNQAVLSIGGKIGTLDALIEGKGLVIDMSTSLAETALHVRSRIGDAASLQDVEMRAELRGPSLAELLAVLGIPYQAGGDINADLVIEDRDPGLAIKGSGNLGQLRLGIDGVIAAPRALDDLQLRITADGKDLSILGILLGQPGLPRQSYGLSGSISRKGERFSIHEFDLHVGESRVRIDGELPAFPSLDRGQLELGADIPHPGQFSAVANGIATLPGPLTMQVSLSPGTSQHTALDAAIRLGNIQTTLKGAIGQHPDYRGTQFDFTLRAPDLGTLSRIAGRTATAGEPLALQGRLEIDEQNNLRISLPGGRVGAAALELDGSLGQLPDFVETDLTVAARGGSLLQALKPFTANGLPDKPWQFDTRLIGSLDALMIADVNAVLDQARLELRGRIGLTPTLAGTDARVDLQLPSLAGLLPAGHRGAWSSGKYRLQGKLQKNGDLLNLSDARITGDRFDAELTASIRDTWELPGADLSVTARAASLAAVLPPVKGYQPPGTPLDVDIVLKPGRESIDFRRFQLQLGETSLEASGSIATSGRQAASLRIRAAGPDMTALGKIDGWALPAEPFHLAANAVVSDQRVALQKLDIGVAEGTATGHLVVDRLDRPRIDLKIDSQSLDLGLFFPVNSDDQATVEPVGAAESDEETVTTARIIPEGQPDLAVLDAFDATFHINARGLNLPDPKFPENRLARAINIKGSLSGGNLQLDDLEVRGDRGNLSATGQLTRNNLLNDFNVQVEAEDFRFGLLSPGIGLMELPAHSVNISLAAHGATYRELTASLNGKIRLEGGSGRTTNSGLDKALGSFAQELISNINPFKDKEAHSLVECTAAAAEVRDGIIMLFPGLVVRTDKIDISASGSIDLNAETLDIQFRNAPRKGIGLSLVGVVRPYIKVGGTLTKPGMILDAPKALLSGSAAVATGGLSILATSLLDRVTTASNPCKEVIANAESGKRTMTLNPVDVIGDSVNRRSIDTAPSLEELTD